MIRLVVVTLLLLALACSDRNLGGEGSGTESTSNGSASDSATSDGSASSAGTSGGNACGGPDQCERYETPCGDWGGCGGLANWLDENGCVRASCTWDSDCAEGQRCYRPSFFAPDGCLPSGFGCEDEPAEMRCVCGATLDCQTSGGVCVPGDDYPTPEMAAGEGDVDDACAPNDAPGFTVRLGGLGTCPPDESRVVITFYRGAPALGLFRFDATVPGFTPEGEGTLTIDQSPVPIVAAELDITAMSAAGISGGYRLWIAQDTHYAGLFADVPYCNSSPGCG